MVSGKVVLGLLATLSWCHGRCQTLPATVLAEADVIPLLFVTSLCRVPEPSLMVLYSLGWKRNLTEKKNQRF